MVTLSRLYVHPVKSMRGLQVSHAQATPSGLAFDRLFMLTDPQGMFLTARQYPQLVQFTPSLLPDGLILTSPDGRESVSLKFGDFSRQAAPTEVWGNQFTALIAPAAVNDWLSAFLKREVQLRWVGPEMTRRVKNQPDIPLSFADGFPYLLLNEASMFDLKQRCPASVRLEQFRPNLVVTGAQAYAEDTWQTIRVGNVIFDLVKPCSRCVLTTVSPERGRKHPSGEPLKTLQGYRTADDGDVDFGQNMIARNTGIIRAGDSVEILATKSARAYSSGIVVENVDLPESREQQVAITYQGKSFTGNNQQILLEQLEQQGFRVPYSCRAGICGSCKLTMKEGEVNALKASAIGKEGKILTCSCVPASDLILE
ncbi:YcbX family protein [Rouxiella chamberiensis]|uniref:YcbX family protein n=1 Tax=Rouxiella chamberiensis TaxID=1513468 RepID=A0ABY7HL69_9GAMM|nr:YcbX family protein [Rouxiella chamberiensis]WAS99680.1 YcbX family protein [Rouxiella chamberiensis]